jgi:hypothetical protein
MTSPGFCAAEGCANPAVAPIGDLGYCLDPGHSERVMAQASAASRARGRRRRRGLGDRSRLVTPPEEPEPAAPTLFDYLDEREQEQHDDVKEAEFRDFHARQPQVFDRYLELCQQWRARGRDAWSSMGAIYVLRFDHRLRVDDPDSQYKITNGFAPWYSRLAMGLLPLDVGQPGPPEFWACCAHPGNRHLDGRCGGCGEAGPRALGYRRIVPEHMQAPGIFETRPARADRR